MNEYEYYFDSNDPTCVPLKSNEEIEIEIRNTQNLEAIKVKAIVASSPADLPDGDTLWMYSTKGREEKPWAIKILGKIEEEEEEVKRIPHAKVAAGKKKGKMLFDMIKEKEARKREEDENEGRQ